MFKVIKRISEGDRTSFLRSETQTLPFYELTLSIKSEANAETVPVTSARVPRSILPGC